jgi:hypothetical protein
LSKRFHERVSEDYAEWFLEDLHRNLEMLIEFIIILEDDDIDDEHKESVVIKIQHIRETINEELEMISQLYDERRLTKKEIGLVRKIKKLRFSQKIKSLEDL